MTQNWLDNPYRSIIEMATLEVNRGGTAIEALEKLKTMMEKSPVKNDAAKKRILEAIKVVKGIQLYDMLGIQETVIQIMKMKLS